MIVLSSTLILSGCSAFGGLDREPIVVETVPAERTPLNLPDPAPLRLSSPEWFIVTPDNVDEVWEQIKTVKTRDVVIFGMTDDGYIELSNDLTKMRNLIAEQRQIILKYREYYESDAANNAESE